LAKRGAVVQFGPVAAPPSDWVTSHQEFSEVTTAFSKNLALYKVKSDLKLACKYQQEFNFVMLPASNLTFCVVSYILFLFSQNENLPIISNERFPGKFYVEDLEV
jgi:hypothetical protein